MARDKGGWLQALWVPIVGVAMVLVIWVCDRLFTFEAPLPLGWFLHFPLLFPCPSLCPSFRHQPKADMAHSVEFVHSSSNQSPAAEGSAVE
jgi:hypothetical protein